MKLKRYVKPASLQEAITILRETDGPVTLLAGGTDVLVYGREATAMPTIPLSIFSACPSSPGFPRMEIIL